MMAEVQAPPPRDTEARVALLEKYTRGDETALNQLPPRLRQLLAVTEHLDQVRADLWTRGAVGVPKGVRVFVPVGGQVHPFCSKKYCWTLREAAPGLKCPARCGLLDVRGQKSRSIIVGFARTVCPLLLAFFFFDGEYFGAYV
jgi:hypothetical protein